jgi:hypothetical protein
MTKPGHADWVGPMVAVALCLLTPLVKPVISLLVALIAMLGMALYYRCRTRAWVGTWALLVGAVVVSMAIVYFMVLE